MYKIWIGWLLVPTLLFSFWVRIYHLGNNPPELFSDEITQVLSAKSIIETGQDINGRVNLFLYNKIKLGTPIYGYAAALSTYIFGDHAFAIRLPAAIFGTLTVLFIFLLTQLITQNKNVALLMSFVSGVVPWGIYFSRIGWEPALTVPFLVAAIYFILIGIKENSFYKIGASFIIFSLSFYASDTLALYSPLFLLTILIINYKFIITNYKKIILPSLLFIVIVLPFIYVTLTNPLKNDRALKLSTFKTGVNRQTIITFSKNYLEHFNYNFLFKKGDPNLRHGTGGDGVLYPILFPFILIGLGEILKKINNKHYQLLLFWLFFFPLGGSLTNDGVPHATRTLIGYPLFIIISAIGISKVKYKFLSIFISIVVAINFFIFFNNYFYIYPINSQSWWEYGQGKVYKYIRDNTVGDESLCLGNIDYWHEETLNHYYLGYKFNYKILYDINDPKCLSSDIVVLPFDIKSGPTYVLDSIILDLNNNPKWNIYRSLNSYRE